MDKTFTYEDVTMHYTKEGSGSPLIVMHGWGCDHTTVASIAKCGTSCHTVYNIDFPGFGKSTEPTDFSAIWGVDKYADLIEAFMAYEGITEPILIGHSFGGRVAIVLGARLNVSKIVLVDAAGVKPRRSLLYYFRIYRFKLLKRILNTLYPKERAQKLIDDYRKKHGSSDYAHSSDMMRAIMSKVVNEDLRHLMPKISAPTLLIWGENDTATPLKDAKIMEKLIPDAGLVVFEGASHYSFLDRPARFATVLNNFVNTDQ